MWYLGETARGPGTATRKAGGYPAGLVSTQAAGEAGAKMQCPLENEQ